MSDGPTVVIVEGDPEPDPEPVPEPEPEPIVVTVPEPVHDDGAWAEHEARHAEHEARHAEIMSAITHHDERHQESQAALLDRLDALDHRLTERETHDEHERETDPAQPDEPTIVTPADIEPEPEPKREHWLKRVGW